MPTCPCCSNKPYEACCAPFIKGKLLPKTPEELMRSRYTAFTKADMPYLEKTMKGIIKENFNIKTTELWAKRVQWLGLEVITTSMEGKKGQVEFIAHYSEGGKDLLIHEVSDFEIFEEVWYYIGGKHLKDSRKTK